MAQSYFHLAARDRSQSWRSLRRRRAQPPISSPHARAATFQSALEQAEQQFRAAATVGYDSRALNLFYGLSQAGRAIAAAAGGLADDEWQLSGHGILARGMDQVVFVGDVRLRTSGQGPGTSFRRLSALLDSEVPDCTLGDVAGCIWEAAWFAPLQTSQTWVPLPIELPKPAISAGQAHWHDGAVSVGVTLPRGDAHPAQQGISVKQFICAYPALRDGRTQENADLSSATWDKQTTHLRLYWPDPSRGGHLDPAAMFTGYRGNTTLAYPTIGDAAMPPHPLMAWWATLFGLSMLARYQPDRWTTMIDIDQTTSATAVEYLLDEAVDAVPDVIDMTLDEIAVQP